jgi:hypothetical protein
VAAGRPAAALDLAGRVRATAQNHGAPPALLSMLQRVAGWAKAQQGHPEEARIRFSEALELARSVDAGYEEALALEALGRLSGDPTELDAAAAILDRLGVVACLAIPLAP